MRFASRKKAARAAVGLACVSALVVGVGAQVTSASADSHRGGTASRGAVRDYLALGDSVTFGYREPNTSPPPNYANASSFVGFPADVGAALGFKVANAACPGESSASFIFTGAQSNGCESSPGGGPGYRTAYPLHVSYSGTQLHYAVRYLKRHPHTRLVSLMIGYNDLALCQATTSDHCASEFPAVATQVSTNVADILGVIRHRAHYRGQVVIVNYYATDYANPADVGFSQGLNAAMDGAAKPFHVKIADGFGAFEAAAVPFGGGSCAAGLLTQLTGGGCGIHPSAAGQALLAVAVERVVKK
jgi:lysophospholipase L1-like esterase